MKRNEQEQRNPQALRDETIVIHGDDSITDEKGQSCYLLFRNIPGT